MREKYLELPTVSRRGFLQAAVIAACDLTSRASEGPYWRPNAPLTRDIRGGRRGETLVVRGVVRGGKPCAPIADTLLDVWQADADGKYDIDYGRGETFLRGQIRTDANGAYELTTIRPAGYGVGGSMRPAHIHFIISAPGRKRFVTQMYFAGDPNLDSDPIRSVYPDLIVAPRGGVAKFDITLG